jgi:hypothetical protein
VSQPKAGKVTAIPANEDDLRAFLQAKSYEDFAAGEFVKDAKGHGPARTFFNPLLLASLQAKNQEHPVGAGSVKELYDDKDALMGWTVSVKTDLDMGGDGWYWFEVVSLDPNESPVAAKNGAGPCVRCHNGGTDLVLAVPPA